MENKRIKSIHSISHTDLDGYGAQYVLSELSKVFGNMMGKREIDLKFSNADYGEDVENIISSLENNVNEEELVIITDLNFKEEQAKRLKKLTEEKGLNLIILDHHITDIKNMKDYEDFYLINKNKCGTELAFELMQKLWKENNLPNNGENIEKKIKRVGEDAKIIGILDLWKKDDPNFKKAQFLSSTMYEGLPFEKDTAREYRFGMIKEVSKMIKRGESLRDIEGSILDVKEKVIDNLGKKIFRKNGNKGLFKNSDLYKTIKSEDLSMADKIAFLSYKSLDLKSFPTFDYKDSKVMVVSMKSEHFVKFAEIANNDPDKKFDIVTNILPTGVMSSRSVGNEPKNSAQRLMSEMFNGGGHFNAAGGKVELGDKPFVLKEIVKDFQEASKLSTKPKRKNKIK